MIEIDNESFNESISIIRSITKSQQKQSENNFDFKSFVIKNHNHKIAAVDGSNFNIPAVNFVIATLRTGYLIYQNENIIEKNISPIKIETLLNTTDSEIGYLRKYKDYYYNLTKEIPEDFLEFDKAAERIRTLMEWSNINELIDKLGHGDIIIFDGSLISGAITTNHLFYETLVSKSKDKGITLIGLSKDTTLSLDNVPIPTILREAAKTQAFNRNWYVELEETFFVRFSKKSDLIFRMDIVHPDSIKIEDVFSEIGAYVYSKKTFGYPFPMQRIHDEVRISKLHRDSCFSILRSDWLKQGKPSNSEEMMDLIKEFDRLFFNYHKQLDIISSGR